MRYFLLSIIVLLAEGSAWGREAYQNAFRYFPQGLTRPAKDYVYPKDTVFESASYDKDNVEAIVYLPSATTSRVPERQHILIPMAVWQKGLEAQPLVDKQNNLYLKTNLSTNSFQVLSEDLKPLVCKRATSTVQAETNRIVAAAQATQAGTVATPPVVKAPVPSAATPQSDLSARMAKKTRITTELNEDLTWFSQTMSRIRASSRSSLLGVQRLLLEMTRTPRFQKDKTRASRLLYYLTLYGEFRRYDVTGQHRTLAHLYWCSESLNNRIVHPPKVPSRKLDIQQISPNYDPQRKTTDFLGPTLGTVAMSQKQFDAWNPYDDTLVDMLTQRGASQDQYLTSDIIDFIGAYEAGLITTAKTPANPQITHYVSPSALVRGRYPYYWHSKRVVVTKGANAFPAVLRLDTPGTNALLNTAHYIQDIREKLPKDQETLASGKLNGRKMTERAKQKLREQIADEKAFLAKNPLDQSRILPEHFEGAREKWGDE